MRIAVVGSREHPDRKAVERHLEALWFNSGMAASFVTGDCRSGVDRFVREWCGEYGAPYAAHEAHWSAQGRAAGPIRNQRVIEDADVVHVIFWQRPSKGSNDAATRAIYAGKPLHTHYDGREP